MKGVKVFDILGKPILTSRQSARRIKPVLSQQPHYGGRPLCLDFSGTHGVSPSFVDEALRVAEECISNSGRNDTTVIFAHPPTMMSSSHRAIARAHGRTLVETENGDWEFHKI
jgi:hypothetical protein